LRPQHLSGRTTALADDGREHDRAIDLAAAALMSCGGGVLEDLEKIRIDGRFRLFAWLQAILDPADIARGIRRQPLNVDVAGLENESRVLILAERQDEVLEAQSAVGLLMGIVVRTTKRVAEGARHRHPAQRFRKRLRHTRLAPPSHVAAEPKRPRLYSTHPVQARQSTPHRPRLIESAGTRRPRALLCPRL
jgi:hypothetical protein